MQGFDCALISVSSVVLCCALQAPFRCRRSINILLQYTDIVSKVITFIVEYYA